MRVDAYCTTQVSVAAGETDAAEAARLMREAHVGNLVVVDAERRPVGIVTDRDLVIEVMASGVEPASVTLADLPSRELCVARGDDDLMATLGRMRKAGVRRMPVVDDRGVLTGILAVDDVMPVIGKLAGTLADLVDEQRVAEVRGRP